MKKILILLLLIFSIVGCKKKENPTEETLPPVETEIPAISDTKTYEITYNIMGHGITPEAIISNSLPREFPVLSADGYEFGGWFLDEACTIEAIACDPITKDTILYAKWIEIIVEHTCDFTGEFKYDEEYHWHQCYCGKFDEKVTHSGGEATEENKAMCEVCGQPYGQLKEPSIVVLDTPVLTLDEETGVVTWDEVLGATHYNYIVSGGEVQTTLELSIILENESNISVQAANDESVSEFSYAITYYDVSDVVIKEEKEVYVYFHNTNLSPVIVKTGQTVSKPLDLTKENYVFDDFYVDPFYQEKFDFSKPIEEKTIIYANWLPTDLIKDTYYWVKGDPKMTANIMSSVSNSGWHFTPLKVNEGQTEYKEYYVTVSVSGASTSNPCNFIVMDGFDDEPGRTYWKKADGRDFTIKSDGIYNIYFSVEHQYDENVHISVATAQNTSAMMVSSGVLELSLSTPVVSVDNNTNTASWSSVTNASKYEVIINNGEVIETTDTFIELPTKSHISVRAISDTMVSKWSSPKANLNYIYEGEETDNYIYVYFKGLESVKINKNTQISKPNDPTLDGHTFGGWYYDLACTREVIFPTTLEESAVFYPKWELSGNYTTDEYYNLVTADGTKVKGLVWNLDNYSYDEYETGLVSLTKDTQYYIEKINSSQKWGPYTVSETGKYRVYFSEDYYWDNEKDTQRNIYFALQVEKVKIYFSNNKFWNGDIKAYVWNDSTGEELASWPGTKATWVKKNEYNQDVYMFEVNLDKYDSIIFTNGNGSQTADISLTGVASGTGYYIKDNSDKEVTSYKYE